MKEPQLMMSFKPIWAFKITNGEKEIEVRRNINYKWTQEQIEKNGGFYVNMYVTLDGKGFVLDNEGKGLVNQKLFPYAVDCPEHRRLVNGKVIGRFWCDKVEKIVPYKHFTNDCDYNYHYRTYDVPYEKLLDYTCLCNDELDNYLDANIGYALHVAKGKVEIFEKPKSISNFYNIDFCKTKLKKAPQSWCYVGGD